MSTEPQRIRKSLRDAGFTSAAIDAVWPQWWSDEAAGSVSATAELRYSLSRRLGLGPSSLFEDEPTFVWTDDTRFKNLGAATEREAAILASFSVAVGRCAVAATRGPARMIAGISAAELRAAMLASSPWVSLTELVALCWGVGVPVIQLEVFPLAHKRMHAAAARVDDRHAILIGRRSAFPAQIAYYIAHEIGHVALGHSSDAAAVLDVGDPLAPDGADAEEEAADRYALELLTGRPDPQIESTVAAFSAAQLAQAATDQAPAHRIDPNVLALCMGHHSGRWKQVFGALKRMYPGEVDVAGELNGLARHQFAWDDLPDDSQDFLLTIMGGRDRAR